MKVLVAGTRSPTCKSKNLEERKSFYDSINRELFMTLDTELLGHLDDIEEVVQGEAKTGGDMAGREYARYYSIPCKPFPADWEANKKSAGFIRNREMAKYLDPSKDVVACLWDMESPGTADMIKVAKKSKIKTYVINCKHIYEKYKERAENA